MAKIGLGRWIREAMTDEDKDGKCAMLMLVHISAGGDKEVHTVRFGNRKFDPENLGTLFRRKAEGYGDELPGVQQFCLLAFYQPEGGEIRTEPEARHPFTVNGATEFGSLATEAATPQGIVQQTMRHNEALAQTYLRGNANLVDAMSNMISQQQNTISKLLEENHHAVEAVKTIILERVADDHKNRMEQLTFQRGTLEREKWIGLLPSLANSVFDKEVFPVAHQDTALLEAAALHMSEEQFQMLGTILPPTLWAPLQQRFAQILADRRKKEERIAELSAGVRPELELEAHVSDTPKAAE